VPPVSSVLAREVWEIEGVGALRVRVATREDLATIDGTWPALRQPTDWHHAWRWDDICASKRERFAVIANDEPVGIWCCDHTTPRDLPNRIAYRLDYLEVRGDLRSGPIGPFLLTVIASRALEVGADSVILAAFPIPGLVRAYVASGAEERCAKGWNPPPKLIPLVYEHAALAHLQGLADDLVKQP